MDPSPWRSFRRRRGAVEWLLTSAGVLLGSRSPLRPRRLDLGGTGRRLRLGAPPRRLPVRGRRHRATGHGRGACLSARSVLGVGCTAGAPPRPLGRSCQTGTRFCAGLRTGVVPRHHPRARPQGANLEQHCRETRAHQAAGLLPRACAAAVAGPQVPAQGARRHGRRTGVCRGRRLQEVGRAGGRPPRGGADTLCSAPSADREPVGQGTLLPGPEGSETGARHAASPSSATSWPTPPAPSTSWGTFR